MITALALLAAATPASDVIDKPVCDKPVYMVVAGETHDRTRMQGYAKAIAESKLYEKLGGYYINAPRQIASFEGEISPKYAMLIVRFPCLANAKAFWNSQEYQDKIKPLRLNPPAGDYTVTVYPEIPLREDMRGKVGDNSYKSEFGAGTIPQNDKALEPAP